LIKSYQKAYDHLRINQSPNPAVDEFESRIKELEAQLGVERKKRYDLQFQMDELQPASGRIETLQSDIGELREMFKVLIEKPELIEELKKKIS